MGAIVVAVIVQKMIIAIEIIEDAGNHVMDTPKDKLRKQYSRVLKRYKEEQLIKQAIDFEITKRFTPYNEVYKRLDFDDLYNNGIEGRDKDFMRVKYYRNDAIQYRLDKLRSQMPHEQKAAYIQQWNKSLIKTGLLSPHEIKQSLIWLNELSPYELSYAIENGLIPSIKQLYIEDNEDIDYMDELEHGIIRVSSMDWKTIIQKGLSKIEALKILNS